LPEEGKKGRTEKKRVVTWNRSDAHRHERGVGKKGEKGANWQIDFEQRREEGKLG